MATGLLLENARAQRFQKKFGVLAGYFTVGYARVRKLVARIYFYVLSSKFISLMSSEDIKAQRVGQLE